jgi:hypothetical protein
VVLRIETLNKKMKIENILIYFLLVAVLTNCNSVKLGDSKYEEQDLIRLSIENFQNSREFKEGTVFSVNFYDTLYIMKLEPTGDSNLEWITDKKVMHFNIVTISKSVNKFIKPNRLADIKSDSIPNNYIEIDNKLFYWWDKDSERIKDGMIFMLEKYNLLKSNNLDGVIDFYDTANDDKSIGYHYYYCDLSSKRNKLVKTSKGIGYYDPPNLDCN